MNSLEVAGYLLVADAVILQVSSPVAVVGRHVYEAMPREVKEDDLLPTLTLASLGLTYSDCDSMARLGGWDDTFGSGKKSPGGKGLKLRDGHSLDELIAQELRDTCL